MGTVPKNGRGTYGPYATLDDTWDAIRKPLSDAGISIYQRILTIDGKPFMVTMLLHESGEFIDDCELELKFESNNRMTAMQAMGSAITYARRYSTQSVSGVAPGDDDDGAGAGNPKDKTDGGSKNQKAQQQPPASKPTPAKAPAGEKKTPLETSLDFKMPSGPNKGKALRELPAETLRALLKYTEEKLIQQSTPDMLALNYHVETVVKTLPPEAPPTPEDPHPTIDDMPPELNNDPFPEDVPDRPSEPENESQERRPRNAKPKAEKKPDLADFVIPSGLAALEDIDGVVGKSLRQIPEADCRRIIAALDKAMKKGAGEPDFKQNADVVYSVRGFLSSMGLK